jgi:hypothetical protein
MFLADKRKKIGNKIQKNRSPKKLKKKKIQKNPKRMVSSKSTGLKSPRYERPYKNHKI